MSSSKEKIDVKDEARLKRKENLLNKGCKREGNVWEERQTGARCECVKERGREKLPSVFPQHQLCGFYEEQMFTT